MVDRKAKGHVELDLDPDISIDYDFPCLSFGPRVGNTKNQTNVDETFFAKKKVQDQVDEVIACVLQSTRVNKEEVGCTKTL